MKAENKIKVELNEIFKMTYSHTLKGGVSKETKC